ncbi:hypothetical protein [Enhygromyxa salina]|uniref:Dipeptide-binding ABC transporter, periplasmic substrate-binding component n=1 Tax=Enhygromyxa salina TaxID=215803 RepID=A0A2S9YYQ6_9BACT|nr:hypothetical protein [Enhygromyxa salina]PRQ10235.1 hypothetical protein ENSA7_00440 [Enhygromyxa salina]
MRRLELLPIVSAALAVSTACAQPNPAFNDCEPPAQCEDDESGDATLTHGDGDGDGDDDPDTGDADTGRNDTGSTAPETGDGDGDGDPNALPTCPDTVEVVIPIAQDTFLDATYADGGSNGCVIDWNYDVDMPYPPVESPCQGLDFGAVPMHWACGHNGDGSCSSTYLGQFAVNGWADQAPVVKDAYFEVTAKIENLEPALVSIYELDVDPAEYHSCGAWSAGQGYGAEPEECVTTFLHAAAPNLWTNVGAAAIDPHQKPTIAAGNAPISPEYAYHDIALPVSKALVQAWLTGEQDHPGVLLTSEAWLPTEFNLLAQGSMAPPRLVTKLCTDAP